MYDESHKTESKTVPHQTTDTGELYAMSTKVVDKDAAFEYYPTKGQLADISNKSLPNGVLVRYLDNSITLRTCSLGRILREGRVLVATWSAKLGSFLRVVSSLFIFLLRSSSSQSVVCGLLAASFLSTPPPRLRPF